MTVDEAKALVARILPTVVYARYIEHRNELNIDLGEDGQGVTLHQLNALSREFETDSINFGLEGGFAGSDVTPAEMNVLVIRLTCRLDP